MRELLDKILRLKTPAKIAITLALMGVIGGGYYYLFYADVSDEINAASAAQIKLKEERAGYEKRKIEYLAYRNELTQLQEEQREILKVLPRKAEAPMLMSSIQDQVELSGLGMEFITIADEVPEELYVRIPIKMEVTGGFHSITKFFKNLSEMKRIVNVQNLTLIPEGNAAAAAEGRGSEKLRAKFIIATFRSLDSASAAGAAPP